MDTTSPERRQGPLSLAAYERDVCDRIAGLDFFGNRNRDKENSAKFAFRVN